MTILGLAESLKTMNEPEPTLYDPARPGHSSTAYFSKSIKDRDVKSSHNLHSSLQFMVSKFGIDIYISLKTMSISAS